MPLTLSPVRDFASRAVAIAGRFQDRRLAPPGLEAAVLASLARPAVPEPDVPRAARPALKPLGQTLFFLPANAVLPGWRE